MIIEAFGVKCSSCEWAEFLKMDRSELLYYVCEKGLTIEDLYKIKGRKYNGPKPRKPRVSAKMKETQERMGILLEVSGYIDRNDLDDIVIKKIGTHTLHGIEFRGQDFGVYDYRNGGLRLNSGQGLPLWKLDWEDAKVQLNEEGLWDIHRDTKEILFSRIVKPFDEEAEKLMQQLHTVTKGENETKGLTYEGFGKKLTCSQWASNLHIPKTTLWENLQKGKSIEDIAAERGIKYSK